MQKILFFFLLSLSVHGFSQVYFSVPLNVGSSGSYGGYRPRVALMNDTVPLVTWCKAGVSQGTYTSKWIYTPTYFTEPLQIFPSGTNFYAGVIDGPELLVTGDTVYLTVWGQQGTNNTIFLCRSFDGGSTFVDTNVVYTTIKRVEFPSIALLGDGSIGIAFLKSELSELAPEILFTKSFDSGASWSSPLNINLGNPGEPCECCPLNLSANQTYTTISFRNNLAGIRDFYAVNSTDFGNTFSADFAIDTSLFLSTTCPISGVDGLIANDTLYTVHTTKIGGQYQVKLGRTSLVDTVNFNTFLFPGGFQNHPSIAASGDTLAIVWQETSNAQDIFFTYKTATTPWSLPVNLTNATGNQITPDISIRKGLFHIVYYDQTALNRPRYIRGSFSPMTLSIDEPLIEKNMVYPNPFSTEITKLDHGLYKILDMSGNVLYKGNEMEIKNRLTLLPTGSYFLQAEKGIVQKLIKL